jgi:dienelactone hydrolase
MAGLSFLSATGHTDVALVGHSFGGAVVIAAAPFSPMVKAVAALSSQTYGASNAGAVSPRPLLLVHGGADTRLPPSCSEQIYDWANEPKEMVIIPGAEHGLAECDDELQAMLKGWLVDRLDGANREA